MGFIENQPCESIEVAKIVETATRMKNENYRLVVITCTFGNDKFEITYSFDKEYNFQNYRVVIDKTGATLPSITGQFLCAFAYENELQDLFGIIVTDLAVNFNGTFYRTAVKHAFAQPKPETPKA